MNVVSLALGALRRRRQAYLDCFGGAQGDRVLRDLAKFCRANASTFHADERIAGRLDGRREVWLRIQTHLQLNDDDLWALYDGRPIGGEDG